MKTFKEYYYYAPQTVAGVIDLLNSHKDKAKIIAGGTHLIPLLKKRAIAPHYLINISHITSLSYVKWDNNEGLSLGALTSISNLLASELIKKRYPYLHKAARTLGAVRSRKSATIGGYICAGSSDAEMIQALLYYQAKVKLTGVRGERIVPLDLFFTGAGRNIIVNELLVEVIIPPQSVFIPASWDNKIWEQL